MKDKSEKLLESLFNIQEKIISKEWSDSRKKAFKKVKKMEQRQNSITCEQARIEAFKQAERIKSERIKERTNG